MVQKYVRQYSSYKKEAVSFIYECYLGDLEEAKTVSQNLPNELLFSCAWSNANIINNVTGWVQSYRCLPI